MRPRSQLLCLALFLACCFVYENLRTPEAERRAAAPTPASSTPPPLRHAVASAALPPLTPPRVSPRLSSPPLPSPLSPSRLGSPPPPPLCTSVQCAAPLGREEPSWAQLSFQPRIDWSRGGVRGDCVAGELEYILPKYCAHHPRRAAAGGWPSEERLRRIDVHASRLPQASLAAVARLLANRTLLLMGDSVMEQFYNALQCYLRQEGLEQHNSAEFLAFIARTAPLWRMGKRKKPPKLPQQARGGMRMMYARVTTMQPDEVQAALGTADVVVLNWGLHYQRMGQYLDDLKAAFAVLEEYAKRPGKAVVFQETGAQHFKSSDPRGFTTGEYEKRDKSTDGQCTCRPIEDVNVNLRNQVLHTALASGEFPHIRLLPFYSLTRPRWRWHFGNCTHRPNGWNYETCCDCTHFCYSPAMWHAHLYNLEQQLLQTSLASPTT
ncbi:hypothetical protein AB1Y20_012413 [Prymnesium parvum]|uniref:SGNH domain-containing protein n=1 Tax=Prymnesium parvum TaxID=97485 RepID=A0AB34IKK5_PRYPA